MTTRPSKYTSDEDCEKIYDDMMPKAGGIGPGTLVNKAREAGYPDHRPASETFKGYLATHQSAPVAIEMPDEWSFGFHDPVADAERAPITYRDEHKLWPDSPDKTVTQVIAKPKHHKTNFIMGQLFDLAIKGKARVGMLALEGAYGVRTMRLKALAKHYNVPLIGLRDQFRIVDTSKAGTFDLSDPACVTAIAYFAKVNGLTDLFIDTQHRAAGGLDENSATDARVLWNAVELIRKHANVNVILAHHMGKDASKGGRGSSADLASVDQQIELTFDRSNMTVAAKVTARKDGPDDFTVRFKVIQPHENAVPILEPMSAEEFQAQAASQDQFAAQAISAALVEMECVGRARACTSQVLMHQVLSQRGDLPADPEQSQKVVANAVRRLQERVKDDARLQAYGRREGPGKTARWLWYLPETDTEVWGAHE